MVGGFLESVFPGLAATAWQITSPATRAYNCVAWAAQDTSRWWWPLGDDDEVWWPPDVEPSETVAAFIAAFIKVGFSACQDDQTELGQEKVALFAKPDGKPTHAARQLPSGRWTSKLGAAEDIEHDLRALEGK